MSGTIEFEFFPWYISNASIGLDSCKFQLKYWYSYQLKFTFGIIFTDAMTTASTMIMFVNINGGSDWNIGRINEIPKDKNEYQGQILYTQNS